MDDSQSGKDSTNAKKPSTADKSRTDKLRAEWDTVSEAILIEGLQKAVRNGQKSDNNFKPVIYQAISNQLKEQGYTFDHKQVKSRWTRFKAAQKIVDTLLHKFSGFGWDDATKCVTASEKVWQDVLYFASNILTCIPASNLAIPAGTWTCGSQNLQVFPRILPASTHRLPDLLKTLNDKSGKRKKNFNSYNYFRNHAFLLYNEITDIIGGDIAQGAFAYTTTSTDLPEIHSEEENGDGDGGEPRPVVSDVLHTQESTPPDDTINMAPVPATLSTNKTSTTSQKHEHALTPPGSPPLKRRKPTSYAQIDSLCDSVDRLVSGLVPSPKKVDGTSSKNSHAFRVVQAEEGLSPTSLARARRVFRGNNDLAEEYLSFDTEDDAHREARTIWLYSEMDQLN
ncbi:hypothetical protein F5878DRAFT_666660 [Lentinula raphanica]|uniref:Myb/SANT-like domain-containing protein n=1 Tax=Lentinula raphanica TaxID=153919 RepID=A0AA38U4R2_9AGAR|nr:hypothetical protein F5878DRAFT_666660 [Lentinula raphanica]